MSVFDFVTIAVSFVLGLGVTYILESIVEVFRARRVCRLHWVPFAWAGFVLVQQFQFWWALYELNAMSSISAGVFTLLLLLAGVLFLAGALVLPSGEADYPADLADYFTTDGSWGAAMLALFNLMAVVTNVVLFNESIGGTVNLLNLTLAVIAILTTITRNRHWTQGLTLAYAVFLVLTTITASSAVYGTVTG